MIETTKEQRSVSQKNEQPQNSENLFPNSKESELIVLGSMLTNINSLNNISELLLEKDFFYLEHKIIFRTIQSLYKKDKPVDIHLLSEELKTLGQLDAIGGIPYLTSLVHYAGTALYIEEYAHLIKSKSILRQMIETSGNIRKKAMEGREDVNLLLEEAQVSFFAISQKTGRQSGFLISDLLSMSSSEKPLSYLDELEKRQALFQENGDRRTITGIASHFCDLDPLINGFSPSNLMILAARPAMGKTAFALNIAENLCLKENISVGIFSLEMTAEQVANRIICSQSEVDHQKILLGNLTGHEFQRIFEVVTKLQTGKHTIFIDDQPGLKITDLRARARRMKENYDIRFLIIDYLQLLSGSGSFRTQENRQNEISEISRTLKTLARELNIPILCLSQLSRKVEERANHRPMMSDLRESGSIEQDADLVMFLLRREYYDPHDKPGMAELIIAKNRHGSIGSVNLVFEKEFAKFRNYSPYDI